MSKSKIVILVSFIILVVGGIFFGLEAQKRSVIITSNTAVAIVSKDRTIATVDTSATLKLKDGEYCAVAVKDDYSKDKECFMVFKQDRDVAFTIDYSVENLASKLDSEAAAISDVIKNTYPSIINSYVICRGQLLSDGTWYGGVLREKVASLADTGNYYYFIMKKGSNWELKTTPNVVISKYSPEAKDIPTKILQQAHTTQPCDSEVTTADTIPNTTVEPFTVEQPVYAY